MYPTIRSMNSDYTVLINSCDSFEDCWPAFFRLFAKYWPSCDARLLLNTERKDWSFEGAVIECTKVALTTKRGLTWSECLLAALDRIDTPFVLYMQEDYFLDHPVDVAVVDRSIEVLRRRPDIQQIGLSRHGSMGPFLVSDEPGYVVVRRNARYRISTQASLWRVETLKSYLRAEENGWMFEIFGTMRSARRKETFLMVDMNGRHNVSPIEYLHTGIIKGRWLREIQGVFEANGIQVDYSARGFYVPKRPLLRKWDLLRKLLGNPRHLVSQLLNK